MTHRIATLLLLSLLGADLCQSAEPESPVNCASVLERPTYPRLARLASLAGTVQTQFIVRETGRADGVQMQGHPMLVNEVWSALRRTAFPESCRMQRIDVTVEFRLEGDASDQPRTSIVFDSNQKYVVTSNATGTASALELNVESVSKPRRACSMPSPLSRRIASGTSVEFRVPRSASIKESRDVDYVTYHIRYGAITEKLWLTMMFGSLVGDHTRHQDSSVNWRTTKWNCGRVEMGDSRGTAPDGRRWRHINIPLSGYAAYADVPPKAAAYFDRILDSMCCGQCDLCK